MIGVAVLGSTGSVGESTLDVLARHPERFRLVAVAAHHSAGKLAAQIRSWQPAYAALADESALGELRALLGTAAPHTRLLGGAGALEEIATLPEVDCVMAAIVGAAGLRSTLAAARAGKRLLLANKESLVMGGPLLVAAVRESGATLLPIDSEHNAIFQCLPAGVRTGVAPPGLTRVLLTASGGPFRETPREALAEATPEMACAHPVWVMGRKISVDSATLMNKGLELIEAHHLFARAPDELDVVVHPQSIIHGLVEFRDGSVIAQLGSPDMRIPISHCLAWPVRMETPAARLNLAQVSTLSFEEPDMVRFPALALARQALATGGAAPTILNAANEVAVHEFVEKRLGFSGIPALVERTLDAMERRGGTKEPQTVEEALAVDHNARRVAADLLPEIAAMAS